MDIVIERATIFDHSRILNLLVEWFDECLIDGIPKTCGYTGVWLAELISRHLVLIALLGNKLVGTIGLQQSYMPWNNEIPIIINPFLMTDKENRKTGVANKLIAAAKEFAEKKGVVLQISHISGRDAKLKDRYFESIQGFTYAGGNLIYTGE